VFTFLLVVAGREPAGERRHQQKCAREAREGGRGGRSPPYHDR